MKLHTKYQKPGPSSFRQVFFKIFSTFIYVKQVTPDAGPLLTPGLII